MFKLALLILIITFSISYAETWNLIEKNSINDSNPLDCEILGDDSLVLVLFDNGYKLNIFNDGKIKEINYNDDWYNRLKYASFDLLNHDNNLYISNESPYLFLYSNGQLSSYHLDDKYTNLNDEFEYYRSIVKCKPYQDEVLCIANAFHVVSFDTSGNSFSITMDSIYLELLYFYNGKFTSLLQGLNEEYGFGNLRDFVIDENIIWMSTDFNILKYDGNLTKIDLINNLPTENLNLTSIAQDQDYIYLTRPKDSQDFNYKDPFIIKYHKKNGSINYYDFPEVDIDGISMKPNWFYKSETIDGRLYIASDLGLYVMFDDEIIHYDFVSHFKDQLPDSIKSYGVYDFDNEETKFYLASDLGIIYSEDIFTNIKDNKILNPLLIYPNPASIELNIKMPENIAPHAEISIIDLTGQEVLNHESLLTGRDINLDISNLAVGAFTLIIKSGTDVMKEKFEVVR